MTSEFDASVATGPTGSPGVYAAELGAGWRVGGGINGGFLLAVAGNALGQELGATPVSLSAYYLSAARPGAAVVRTEVLKRGKTLSVGMAAIAQVDDYGQDVERLRVVASYGTFTDDGPTFAVATPPVLPPVDECVPATRAPRELLAVSPLLARFDLRLDPATAGWTVGQPAKAGHIQGWLRPLEGEPDPLFLLLAIDSLPPVTFDLALPGWAPTVELTAHLRALPAPGWLRVTHRTRMLASGFFEEDAEVWDSTDTLVAQSRQLARTPLTR
jgi:hypothetical protein